MRDHDDSNCHCHQVHSESLSSSSFRVIVIKFIPSQLRDRDIVPIRKEFGH